MNATTRAHRSFLRGFCNRKDLKNNHQNVHTPFDLCEEMLAKLVEFTDLKDKYICVLNLEFVEVLCYDFGVERKNIWFITDCKEKTKVAGHSRYKGINVCEGNYLLTKCENMKFDIIVGNPPYNKPTDTSIGGFGSRNPLWDSFVLKSLSLLKDGGFLCFVHPQIWRKPENEIGKEMMSKQIHFLRMIGEDESGKIFNVGTKVDWYVLQNMPRKGKTFIQDETGKQIEVDLGKVSFIPNFLVEEISKITVKKPSNGCEVLYSSSVYETRKDYMADKKDKKFKYPCVHALNSEENGGMICWYSNTKDNGHFGIPKVIINGSRYVRPINDFDGKYGLTQECFGIVITSKKEGDLMVAAINTPKFQEIIKATKWSSFRAEWRFFKYLKKDFWKHFVDENGNEII